MREAIAPLLGVACLCVLNAAQAQSSVTLYGVIDNGVEYQNGGKGSASRGVSGGLFASRFGFRGTEDIGDGLHVNFALEQGFNAMNGNAAKSTAAFNRQAWVGMSGEFGEVRLGLQNTPQYIFLNPELDAMAVMSIGSPMNSLNSLTVRANNAISYFTPAFHGLSAQFMAAMRDSTTTPANGFQLYNAAVRYTDGEFRIGAGYEQTQNAANTSILKVFSIGTSYGMGPARVYLAYHTERQTDGSAKRDVYGLSGSYKLDAANQIALMYAYARDRTGEGNNAQGWGLTYEYHVSKRTTLYSAAGLINNMNQAAYKLNGTNYQGIDVAPGHNVHGMSVGIVHRF